MSALAFRNLLEAGDVEGLRAFWREAAPAMPQPETREQAEIMMHMARTASDSVKFRLRAYSHRWLTERHQRSQLPDHYKPQAERIYPVVVEAVGVSVNFRSPYMAPAAADVRGVMERAVEDAYAEGRRDPEFVRARMFEAKDREMRALFGRQAYGNHDT